MGHASLITLRSSRGRPKSIFQGRPLNVRLGRPLGVISGHPQDVKLGRSRDGQIGSLGDVLGTLEWNVLGTSSKPIFAGWVVPFKMSLPMNSDILESFSSTSCPNTTIDTRYKIQKTLFLIRKTSYKITIVKPNIFYIIHYT